MVIKMPNKKLDALRIPDHLSKRKVLSNEQRAEVFARFYAGEAQGMLAKEYSVSRGTIRFITHPETYEIAKAQRRERYAADYKDGRYYDRETGTKAIADLRARKREYLRSIV